MTFGEHALATLRERRQKMAEREKKAATDTSSERIHDLRVACRRMGSALTACAAAVDIPPKVTPKYLIRLVRVVGRLRDLDVQEKVLTEEIAPEMGGDAEPVLQPARQHLRERRSEAERKVIRALTRPRHHRFVSSLDDWLGQPKLTQLATLPLEAVRADILLPPLATLLLHEAWPLDLSEALGDGAPLLHDLRKTARRMRYLGECLEGSYGPEFAAWLGELARVQDTLGSLHDSQLLLDYVSDIHEPGARQRLSDLVHSRQQHALADWGELRTRYLDPRWRADLRAIVLGETSAPANTQSDTTTH
ncbi:MAG TPA: CHAD domain-containing protein [Gemmatimonadales bacterium]|nr:CHAD domain-containing protein [Gemmatimonadales bacterium]